jgi:hypothetical protein
MNSTILALFCCHNSFQYAILSNVAQTEPDKIGIICLATENHQLCDVRA